MPKSPLSPEAEATALGAAFWVLYRLTASWDPSYEGVCYALDAESGSPESLFHPRHLLHAFLGRTLAKTLIWLGHPMRAMEALETLNASWAAGAVAVFYAALRPSLGRGRAAGGAAVLGLSHALWSSAVDPAGWAGGAFGAAVLCGLLFQPHRAPPLALGIATGAAGTLHPSLLAAAPGLFLRRGWGGRAYLVFAAFFSAFPFVAIAGIGWLARGGPPLDPNRVLLGGIGQALAGPVFGAGPVLWLDRGVSVLALAALARWSLPRLRALPGPFEGRDVATGLWTWVGGLLLLGFSGVGIHPVLFLVPVSALVLELSREPGLPRVRPTLAWAGGAGLLGALLAFNLLATFLPGTDPEGRADVRRARGVANHLRPGDFFAFLGEGPGSIVNVYVAYLAPHVRGRSLQGYLASGSRGLEGLVKAEEEVRSKGGAVFFEGSLWDGEGGRALLRRSGLDGSILGNWLGRFEVLEEKTFPDGYRIVRVGARARRPGPKAAAPADQGNR